MKANDIMAEEILKAGTDPKLVELLNKVSKFEILNGDVEISGEQEYRLRLYTRQMLAMSEKEFKAHFESHKFEIEIAKRIVLESN